MVPYMSDLSHVLALETPDPSILDLGQLDSQCCTMTEHAMQRGIDISCVEVPRILRIGDIYGVDIVEDLDDVVMSGGCATASN